MDRIARRRKVWKVVGGVCATAAAVLCAFMLIDIPQETNRIHIIENGEVVTTAESIRHSERQRRISTDEPRHSERQRRISTDEPRHSERQRRISTDEPRHSERQRRISTSSDTTQKASATDSTNSVRSFGQSPQDDTLRHSERQRRISTDEPRHSERQRRISTNEPRHSERQRRISTDEPRHSERQRRISLGFGSDLSRLTGAVVRGGDKISSAVGASPSWGNNYSEDVVFPNISGDNVPTTINNPVTLNKIISVGIYAKYGFSENFFAAGGLELTYYTTSGKDLLYLGPSIGIGYDIYKNYKVDIYASISGLPEWCLSSSGYPALISTSLTAGAQFRLGNITWIALEPQLRYYAYTGSGNKVSMRQPLCFSFNLGFRFDL